MRLKFLSFSNLTLLVALSLSSVAAYYSIIGLTAIFAGAVIPVIIMGSILEVGKITTTVWLRKYWSKASWVLKLYLVPAVIALALLTSMGIFGFLSKAHMEQGITSGDAQGKVAIYDEKIKTSKDNIDANRKALKQLDEAVDQVMGRSTSEQGADKAVAVRRSQANDRKRLLAEIQEEQKTVSKLSEERAPLASELRKIEAEVGPIKYIAALIYGDNADANMLEAAVRWVIILLVVVFDPLAIALVLAANASKEWDLEIVEDISEDGYKTPFIADPTVDETEDFFAKGKLVTRALDDEESDRLVQEANKLLDEIENPIPEVELPEKTLLEQHPYLNIHFDHFTGTKPMVYIPEKEAISYVQGDYKVNDAVVTYLPAHDIKISKNPVVPFDEIKTENVTKLDPIQEVEGGYVTFNGALMQRDALKGLRPDIFSLTADSVRNILINFGTKFPEYATKGDVFVRVDALPNRVYKFDSSKWIEVNKDQSDSYLHNQEYIKYLVDKIENGEYDIDLLSETEKAEVADYLTNQKG